MRVRRQTAVAVASPRCRYQFSAGKTEITTEYYWPLWLLNQIFLVSSNTVADTQTANGDDGGDGEKGERRKKYHRRARRDEDGDNDAERKTLRRRWGQRCNRPWSPERRREG